MTEMFYRGSIKHKRRPAKGRKGTRCPEWTHNTKSVRLGIDMPSHDWPRTIAAALLSDSYIDPEGSGKRYATRRGIAFVGQNTADGTWHGYPVPWNDVPAGLKDAWSDERKMTRRDLKRYAEFDKSNIDWALESDDE